MNIIESIYHICTSTVGKSDPATQLAKANNRAAASALMKDPVSRVSVVGQVSLTINARLTEQEQILQNRFKGYRLKLRGGTDAVNAVAENLKEGMNVVRSLSTVDKKLTTNLVKEWMADFIEAMGVPSDLVDTVNNSMLYAGNETLKNAIGQSLPFIGLFYGVKDAKKCGEAVYKDMNDRSILDKHSKFALPGGNPGAATQALRTLLNRELAFDVANAGRSFAVVGSEIAGLCTDLGTISNAGIGLANTAAQFLLSLGRLVLIALQVAIGNRILERTETLDTDVFEQCPILGCFYLQAAQAVNLVDIYFKVDGTVDEAHRAQALANMEPIMTLVEGFIEKSNVYLAGMSSDGAPVSMPVLTRTS